MAELLGIPLGTLKHIKEASPSVSSSPEYWEKWYNDTLESSAEPKRASRDFKSSVSSCVAVIQEVTEVIYVNFGVSPREEAMA
ncbi:hypothetical protein PR003_g23574 [Phytophthora rubi]|uniref:Uncharacterized protein n=1 Tax=Phytophthora rubi TaxID=129364 RepID=A0A6A4CUT6_9STRA|nr:hypothetical protein PR003_g23574 [Phytophthora rubi]